MSTCSRSWCALLLLFALSPLLAQACAPTIGDPLLQRLPAFAAHQESRVAALLRLGREHSLCFGLETFSEDLNQRITLAVPPGPARQMIFALLGDATRYDVTALHRVILIRDRREQPLPELARRLPRFQSPRDTLVRTHLALWMRTERYLNPSLQGFAGDGPPSAPDDLVGPFEARNETVRSLLCRLIASSKGASWAYPSPLWSGLGTASGTGLWILIPYHVAEPPRH